MTPEEIRYEYELLINEKYKIEKQIWYLQSKCKHEFESKYIASEPCLVCKFCEETEYRRER